LTAGLVLALLPLSLWAYGQGRPGDSGSLRITEQSDGMIEFEYVSPSPRFQPVSVGDGTRFKVMLEGAGMLEKPGDPALPRVPVALGIPGGAVYRIEVSLSGRRVFPGVTPARVPPTPGFSGSLRADAARAVGTWPEVVPGESVGVVSDSRLRNQRVLELALHPAVYDGASRSVVWYERMRVRVYLGGEAGRVGEGRGLEPNDPFEGVYKARLLNYEQAKKWRLSRPLRSVSGVEGEYFSSYDVWIKISVRDRGWHQLTFEELEGICPEIAEADPSSFRMFNSGNLALSESGSPCEGDSCFMKQCALIVQVDSPGTFTRGDRIAFFGHGAKGWADEFVNSGELGAYRDNQYTDDGIYWLTWGDGGVGAEEPLRVRKLLDGTPDDAGAFEVSDSRERLHFEQDNLYDLTPRESGQKWEKWWYRRLVGRDPASTLSFRLPEAVRDSASDMTLRFWGASSGWHRLLLTLNGTEFADTSFSWLKRVDVHARFPETAVENTLSMDVLKVESTPDYSGENQVYLAWFDVGYRRKLVASGERIEFNSPAVAGNGRFHLSGFSGDSIRVFDVTDPWVPVEFSGAVISKEMNSYAAVFEAPCFKDSVRKLSAVGADGYLDVDRLEKKVFGNDLLRQTDMSARYVVITHRDFRDAAESLADARAESISTAVVEIQEIYDEYAFGMPDPTAVKYFMLDAWKRWTVRPAYLLLLGDASYDFKNLTGQGYNNWVPTYENYYKFASDEWFVMMDGPSDTRPDLAVGRIPVRNKTEAERVIRNKIIPYERTPVLGEWKNTIMLVADDSRKNPSEWDPLGNSHLEQTEMLDSSYVPYFFDRKKVYLNDYDYFGGTGFKSGARQDFKDAVNSGVLSCTYVGHGGHDQLADEQAFTVYDVPGLSNTGKPFVFVSASCDVGVFDDPTYESIAEALVNKSDGGSVVSIAAVEFTSGPSNFSFVARLFSQLFAEGPVNCPVPFGVAMQMAKSGGTNDLKYVFLGDPATSLACPRYSVVFDSTSVDTARIGRRYTVSGFVDKGGVPDESFDGEVALRLIGSALGRWQCWCWGNDDCSDPAASCDSAHYWLPGRLIYEGSAPVRSGRFTQTFFVPVDSTELAGNRAKLRAYVSNGLFDAAGARKVIVTTGVEPEDDAVGPEISLSFSGGVEEVTRSAVLRIGLSDPQGILLVDTEEDLHGIYELSLLYGTPEGDFVDPREMVSADQLMPYFSYDFGSSEKATLNFPLSSLKTLSLGRHVIRFWASDNLHNSNSGQIEFTVVSGLSVKRVINFPNPFSRETYFYFEVPASSSEVRAEINVYTVSGRLIKKLRPEEPVEGAAQIRWDGLDDYGDEIATGVYLYEVVVTDPESGERVTKVGKAAKIRGLGATGK